MLEPRQLRARSRLRSAVSSSPICVTSRSTRPWCAGRDGGDGRRSGGAGRAPAWRRDRGGTEGRDRPGQRDDLGRSARGDRDIGVHVPSPTRVRPPRRAGSRSRPGRRRSPCDRPRCARTTRTATAATTSSTRTASTSGHRRGARRAARRLRPGRPHRRSGGHAHTEHVGEAARPFAARPHVDRIDGGTSSRSHLTPAQQLCQLPGHGGRGTLGRGPGRETRGRGTRRRGSSTPGPATSRAVGPSPPGAGRARRHRSTDRRRDVERRVVQRAATVPARPAQPVQVEHTDRAQRQSREVGVEGAEHRPIADKRSATDSRRCCDVVPLPTVTVMNSTLFAPCADHYPHALDDCEWDTVSGEPDTAGSIGRHNPSCREQTTTTPLMTCIRPHLEATPGHSVGRPSRTHTGRAHHFSR